MCAMPQAIRECHDGSVSAPSPTRLSLHGSIAWFVGCYALTLAGYLGVNGIAGRTLGPADFGWFAIALSLTAFVGQTVLVGSHRAALRSAARIIDDDAPVRLALRETSRAASAVALPVS